MRAKTITSITLLCNDEYTACKPARVEPTPRSETRRYELFSDAVVKNKGGQEFRCKSSWRSFETDEGYYACGVSGGKQSISLFERFGEGKNSFLQIMKFDFNPLACNGVSREIRQGVPLETRYDVRCEVVE